MLGTIPYRNNFIIKKGQTYYRLGEKQAVDWKQPITQTHDCQTCKNIESKNPGATRRTPSELVMLTPWKTRDEWSQSPTSHAAKHEGLPGMANHRKVHKWIIQNAGLGTPQSFTQQFIYITEVNEGGKLYNIPSKKKNKALQFRHLAISCIWLTWGLKLDIILYSKACCKWR